MSIKPNAELSKDAEIFVGAIMLDPLFTEDLYQNRGDIEQLTRLLRTKGIKDTKTLAQALNELDWESAKRVFQGFGIVPADT